MTRRYNLTRLQMETVQRFGRAFSERQTELEYYPLSLQLEVSSGCNFRCVGCPQGQLEKGEKGVMSMDLVDKVIDEVAGKSIRVGMVWRGEPFINKRIVDITKKLHEKGLAPWTVTNGSLLNPQLSEDLIKNGLDYICFSIDGTTKEKFEKIRLGGKFEEVLDNFKTFLDKKRQFGTIEKPWVVVTVIDFDLDLDMDEIREFFGGDMVNEVSRLVPHSWAGSLEDATFEVPDPEGTDPCAHPWNHMVIGFDGTVGLCCMDYLQRKVMGDVNTSSVMEIWNGEEFKSVRQMIAADKHVEDDVCGSCVHRYTPKDKWLF